MTGVAKVYAGRTFVLENIDLTVAAGERVALIGANGSGKSTLLRCVIGLHDISAGRVDVLGQQFDRRPTRRQRQEIRRRTGFVFQRHSLVARRSVLSNVVHGMLGEPGSWRGFSQATARAAWRAQALDALAEVSLAARAAERADRLSGGQQQRVAVARAIVRRPALLIADEPAASLDPVSGRDVMRLFERVASQHGIALLFTTHDMDHARLFSNRMVALKGGRIIFDRPTDDVTSDQLGRVFDG